MTLVDSTQTTGWQLAGKNVCFKTKDNAHGQFIMKTTGLLHSIKLVYKSGSVTCWTDQKMSNWGCDLGERIFVVVTDDKNNPIAPVNIKKEGNKIPPYESMSPEILLNITSKHVQFGDTFRLWYLKDLLDDREGYTSGETCVDVYTLVEGNYV